MVPNNTLLDDIYEITNIAAKTAKGVNKPATMSATDLDEEEGKVQNKMGTVTTIATLAGFLCHPPSVPPSQQYHSSPNTLPPLKADMTEPLAQKPKIPLTNTEQRGSLILYLGGDFFTTTHS